MTYSTKEDRDSNVAKFRVFYGVGLLFSPFFWEICSRFSDFTFAFALLGIIYAVIICIIYCKLVEAREIWNEEKAELARDLASHEIDEEPLLESNLPVEAQRALGILP